MRSFNSLDLRINTELAPDLEWMLTNPQSNRSTLAETLILETVELSLPPGIFHSE